MPDPKEPPWHEIRDVGEDDDGEDELDEALEETFPASDPISPMVPGFD